MSTTAQAKRVRRQWAIDHKHLPKLGRPIYRRKDTATAAARLARVIAREKQRALNKGRK